MKIIHTGDWHIGKIVHQIHMTEDQKYVLENFVSLIKEESPDVIVIAGDLYDRSVPPVEAVELLDNVFSEILIELNTPIIAIAGNHDSPDRVGFASKILRDKGFFIEGKLRKDIQKVTIKDEFGAVNFYLVPYADPALVRGLFQDDSIHSHDDAMKAIIQYIKSSLNKSERNVIVAHGFVIGGVSSESERPLSIGGTEFIDVSYFDDFNYTALGHLHGPQKIGSNKVRYSGSLLKYSFSEARQNKSVTIVNIDESGNLDIELKQLSPARDMRAIRGKLEDLLNPDIYKDTNFEDYLYVELEDEGELIEPMSKLRAVYPNVLKLTRSSFNRNIEGNNSAGDDFNKKSMLELFEEFYTGITGRDFSHEKKEVLVNILKEVDKQERGE
ncbi:exonuclease SbcCD subunit D [Clostridium sp. DJ247]|uniref:exonuclease SbcCD subunit D n=1 Tax=Clostridium sp. DJ247 TaxID=2726188 RepID=UPI001628CDD9|nr:exonuclease SbcCD subunit D [Clostridium sp. DJ247]MBC2581194.1 exonuclease SbcCD subunit D [Clostridium sp. DJ247]